MYDSSLDSVRRFRNGRMNYIIDNDRSSMNIVRLVSNRLGVPVDTEPLPVGIREYKKFSEKIGNELGIQEKAAKIAAEEENRYFSEIGKIRPILEGKKVLIEDKFAKNIDWLIELVLDLGMEIVTVGVGPEHRWKEKNPESRYFREGIRFRFDYSLGDMLSDIEALSPDIVLLDSGITELDNVRCAMYSHHCPGLNGVLDFGRKIGDLVRVPLTEGWRRLN